jgi:hypothetical protein
MFARRNSCCNPELCGDKSGLFLLRSSRRAGGCTGAQETSATPPTSPSVMSPSGTSASPHDSFPAEPTPTAEPTLQSKPTPTANPNNLFARIRGWILYAQDRYNDHWLVAVDPAPSRTISSVAGASVE